MDLLASLQIAWRSLLVNKMRSLLTMLGVIIGVGAVIIMVSLSQGASAGITDRISSMGSNLLMVTSGGGFGPVRGANSSGQLSMADVEAISQLPMVKHTGPESSTQATLTAGSLTWTASVSGTVPALQDIKDWPTRLGGFITAEDVSQGNLVAVIGQTVVDNLYPGAKTPVGSRMQINGLEYTVIGVLTSRGAQGSGSDQDNAVYIPITTAQQRLLGSSAVRTINIQASNAESLQPLKEVITNLLRQRHRLAADAENDFNIQDMAQVLSTIEDTTRIMTFLLGGIAAVSLLVGGIGIMNIMLVSVTERTREIGVRMAVGATTRDILTQFLIEALLLCVIGGIIGVLLGWGGSYLLGALADFKIRLSPWLVALALGFSLMVGLFFGYYPASQAARSNPIEALRFE